MGRAPCCETSGLKKGPWTPEEDQKLIDYIQKNGYGNWRTLPKNAGLQRCGKSCRLRWTNYLRPDIKRGRFSFEEEEAIIQLHSVLGNKWSAIAARLPGRTDNEIKNYWNTHIRKRLLRMGIDPVTHSPRLDLLDLSSLLMGMQSSSATVDPELLRIATALMSQCQSQTNNEVGDYYGRTQFDPTRLVRAQCNTYSQHQQDHQHHLHQSLFQQQMPGAGAAQFYNPIAETNLSDDDRDYVPMPPFTGFYNYASEQSTGFTAGAELSNPAHPTMNSVISTPSSSPTHINNSSSIFINSSSSTEDERERENNSLADYSSALMTMMMKFETPEILDVNDFIY